MANTQLGTILRHIHAMRVLQQGHTLADNELLQRFSVHQDEAAFTAIVQRHGPMVLGVCRHVLHHEQDAEDAFQSTFLVFARRASAVRKGDSLASWLHGVAYRVALRSRRDAARRQHHEGKAREMTAKNQAGATGLRDLQAVLDEEVQRLPEKYHTAFVLCCIEGKSRPEAARELGWKEGTLSTRVAQARRLLRQRLARRGVTLSAVLCASSLSSAAVDGAVPRALATATIRSALQYVAQKALPAGLISAEVAN